MMGHYPPNCYKGNGWELVRQESCSTITQDNKPDWIVGNLHISQAWNMNLRSDRQPYGASLWVRNFFHPAQQHILSGPCHVRQGPARTFKSPCLTVQVQIQVGLPPRIFRRKTANGIFQSLMMAILGYGPSLDAVRKRWMNLTGYATDGLALPRILNTSIGAALTAAGRQQGPQLQGSWWCICCCRGAIWIAILLAVLCGAVCVGGVPHAAAHVFLHGGRPALRPVISSPIFRGRFGTDADV